MTNIFSTNTFQILNIFNVSSNCARTWKYTNKQDIIIILEELTV